MAIFELSQISQKLSIRFERNFLPSFYTIVRPYVCNDIKIDLQKFDSKNTYIYQKIWKFFSRKSEKPGRFAIIRMKMRRNQACLAEKTIWL